MKTEKREEIQQALLQKINNNELNSTLKISQEFGISRQTLYKYLTVLEAEGKIVATKQNNRKKYSLKEEEKLLRLKLAELEEDLVWSQEISPFLKGIKANVLFACQYGFTEILNNAIDHSESKDVLIMLSQNPVDIKIWIIDYGVGIFNKIQKAFSLNSPRDSIWELAKGKLTTDPDRHSGEEIFFTSRIFDDFVIFSEKLAFKSGRETDMDILQEIQETNILVDHMKESKMGTIVFMKIAKTSDIVTADVFDKYTAAEDDYGFTKTHIIVRLLDQEGILLVSRSQAKRLIARFEKFKEVILDFEGVKEVGQAFADEIFRVFAKQHPNVELIPVNLTEQVKKMVYRAQAYNKSLE
ncbi:MAG: DUF4325 domain-containing protein [Sporomusaceae bacterium]|nr:DUF4325 domain-containing protein [Sporomusaceae bacterium]